ncbi:hypothetical protein RRG08_004549 [Elysia crispata]|uniref:Uncharacterized protein n=1 Tax=Elysia crispata TaxID=231223 RepID=A0AAE1BA62_9GAST|nr:hypothetical protein RRG08_004549 [Elysia crispata]
MPTYAPEMPAPDAVKENRCVAFLEESQSQSPCLKELSTIDQALHIIIKLVVADRIRGHPRSRRNAGFE